MKKRCLPVLLALAMTFTLCVPALADTPPAQTEGTLPFTDVAENHWAYDDILYCYEKELFTGKTATTFDPNGKLTVAEAVALAGRLCSLTHGGDGALPELPDLTKSYARFYDENGKLFAEFNQDNGPVSFNDEYIALTGKQDDTTLPKSCTMELGLEGFSPIKTFQGTWKSYAFAGGHMSYGYKGTGYLFEEKIYSIFSGVHYAVNPDYTAAKCVNEWWYPAAFWLQYYGYNVVTDMCYHIGLSHPNPDGSFSSSDALSTFSKERATRAMFACLINGAVEDELEVINDTSAIPDVDDMISCTSTTGAVLRLYGAGILVGVDKTGRFHGDGELTRAQAATILARVLQPEARQHL